jgi:hypothetical protein
LPLSLRCVAQLQRSIFGWNCRKGARIRRLAHVCGDFAAQHLVDWLANRPGRGQPTSCQLLRNLRGRRQKCNPELPILSFSIDSGRHGELVRQHDGDAEPHGPDQVSRSAPPVGHGHQPLLRRSILGVGNRSRHARMIAHGEHHSHSQTEIVREPGRCSCDSVRIRLLRDRSSH